MDRNQWIKAQHPGCRLSLSARRAWIEILSRRERKLILIIVALRKESVDRNHGFLRGLPKEHLSLSARRAWIEISVKDLNAHLYYVALRKESVDRNACIGFH